MPLLHPLLKESLEDILYMLDIEFLLIFLPYKVIFFIEYQLFFVRNHYLFLSLHIFFLFALGI